MPFSSSPVLYPPSSSPPGPARKRKLYQPFPIEPEPKKTKVIGGFLEDSEEDEYGMRKDKVSVSTVQHEASIHEVEKSIYGVGAKPRIGTRPSEPEKAPRSSSRSPSLPPAPRSFLRRLPQKTIDLQTSSGFSVKISQRTKSEAVSFEKTIAQRSITAAGRAKKSYYGIDIHRLMDEATTQRQLDEAEAEVRAQKESTAASEHPPSNRAPSGQTAAPTQMWTEKYRAKKFTELVGDERTHRAVLRWLKAWDSLVFPGSAKPKPKRIYEDKERDQEKAHRKILLLTGPPGLGKTTLAHVCAKQAGYEVLEINASDDRSRDVVRGRIKDALGTETVRGIQEPGKPRRAGRPVCVVVDEVDGAVAGSSGNAGEGGFIKALIDLVQLDQRNSSASTNQEAGSKHRNKNGDKFKLLRPLILVCNDVYAPALRPLRSASVAEIVHVRKPPIEKVVTRLKQVFEKERIPCDHDAVRRLCESSWGLGTRKQNGLVSRGSGEGDIRGVLVQGEWIAHKLRASPDGRLTRKWLEPQLGDTHSTAVQKGLGRGGVREVVERIFLDGAGLPDLPTTLSADEERLLAESKTTPTGVSDVRKRAAITALREMIDTCGDYDRLMTDCFATYPTQAYQDDVQLSKPNACYDWLYFHDCLSRRIFSGQEWELNPYLSTSACGFHHLFAAVRKDSLGWNEEKKEEDDEEAGSQHPFSGVKADFAAREAEKHSRTILTELQSTFSANLLRLFNSVDVMATELIPSVGRILSPHVKPVVIGGSGGSGSIASVRKETEKTCIRNAVRVMAALNIAFEKVRVEIEGGSALLNGGYAYRMEPPLDTLATFHMDKTWSQSSPPVRYAVRQVLDQELKKEKLVQGSLAREARSSSFNHVDGISADDDKENDGAGGKVKENDSKAPAVKRDFFGRIVNDVRPTSAGKGSAHRANESLKKYQDRVWVSFHEGFSNAVRRPITLQELMDGF